LGNWLVCLLRTIALLGIMGGMACSGPARYAAAICLWWCLRFLFLFLFPAARRGRALVGIAVVAHGGVAVCWLVGQGDSFGLRWGSQQAIIVIIVIIVLGGASVATQSTTTVLLLGSEAQGARRRRVLRGCSCCRCWGRQRSGGGGGGGGGGGVLQSELCDESIDVGSERKRSSDIQVAEAGGGGSGRGNEMLEVVR
jgi:hypothetical protein